MMTGFCTTLKKSSPDHSVYYYKDNIINTNLKTLNSRVQKSLSL